MSKLRIKKLCLNILEELVFMFFWILISLILIINEIWFFPFFEDLNMLERLFTLLVISLIIYFSLLLIIVPWQDKISKKFAKWKQKQEKD